ncbi:D-alanine--poly(phosphoribitol) ligase [Streptomyces sp. AJS327]|uniref:AMP-binding protein n=1 Tax=Streptomyces sp. AJS327 TaxID=2545265 RepID=UPI0015DE0884|nr:AMP-binding protein [Streptomyces sp. AJS327]MBA0053730.1 D-alanine--poly(phosphoribitol) ligase [Streptomyces sp. AJS327]
MRLHEPVIDAARRDPDALAVHAPDGALTYGELDALAGRFSAALAARGVTAGDRVVLWTGKTAHAVALMQGCLRRGAAYVPVTESNPAARVARIANGCAAALAVAPDAETARAAEWDGPPLLSCADLLDGAPETEPPPAEGSVDDLAYILYTSGSTGEPKGVCLSHRNALGFVDWAVERLGLGPRDRLSGHAPFNFDLSVFDLYAAFRAGASVHLISQEMAYAPEQLVRFLEERQLTVWYSVPSALTLMMSKGGLLDGPPPPALHTCLFAGEPFPPPLVRRLGETWPGVRLFNWYGPTETNVCTSYEVTAADLRGGGELPIGRACSGDELTLKPTDREGEFELLVSGPTVMLGYWGRQPHSGPYATGDVVRVGAEGNLWYVGRRDQMVKIRGQRVELGEIESVLSTHPAVGEAAVLVIGEGLEAALHAVVTPAEPGTPVSLLGLKGWSADRLPPYMVLDTLHVVDELKRTANGKKDRTSMAREITGEVKGS